MLTDGVANPHVTLLQAPTFTDDGDRRRLWAAAFGFLRPTVAFAHVSLVLNERTTRRRVVRDAATGGLAVLQAAAERSRPTALPAEDGGPPLGRHVELDDPTVVHTLRDLAPHLLHVQVFAESDRRLLADHGAAVPMLDFDDFGEVLQVHVDLATFPAFLAAVTPLTAWIDVPHQP